MSVTGVEHIDVSRKIKKILRIHKTKEEKRTGGNIILCECAEGRGNTAYTSGACIEF